MNVVKRFWSKVDKSGDCWEWQACRSNGYGSFDKKRAHRICWELTFGSIPDGFDVLHHCDNKACVRPNHLFLGTNGDNNRDRATKGRSAYGEANGNSKLKATDVLRIRELAIFKTQRSVARMFGISQAQVSSIITREQWAGI